MIPSLECPPSNGVLRIGRKGTRKFQFGDDEPFEIDVVLVHNKYAALDATYRDENGKLLEGKEEAHADMTAQFVAEISGNQGLTYAEVFEFRAVLQEEADKLRTFFDPALRRRQSLPGNTETSDS